jgi:hypothetical protein
MKILRYFDISLKEMTYDDAHIRQKMMEVLYGRLSPVVRWCKTVCSLKVKRGDEYGTW